MAGNTEKVAKYVTQGEDINYSNPLLANGNTPLIFCVLANNLEIAKLLLENGADPNKQNVKTGDTALLLAIDQGKEALAGLFLEYKADPDICSKKGSCPLVTASYLGQTETVRLLIQSGALLDISNNYGITSLMFATEKGHESIMEMLITNGANLESISPAGETALHIASLINSPSAVKLLLGAGSNINTQQKWGSSALLHSATNKQYDIVKILIDNGADINLSNMYGITPLMCAAINGDLNMMKLLLESGADINSVTTMGITALFLAFDKGQNSAAEMLIRFGINEKENNFVLKELNIAANKGRVDLVELILDNDVGVNDDDAAHLIDLAYRVRGEIGTQQQAQIAQQRAQQRNDSTARFFLTILNGAAQGYAQKNTNRTYTPPPSYQPVTITPASSYQPATLKAYDPPKTAINQLTTTKTYTQEKSSIGGCSSDFNCGTGHKCTKKPGDLKGVCMKVVNQFGTQKHYQAKPSSIQPKMSYEKECQFSSDCPPGFTCDPNYKVCVK